MDVVERTFRGVEQEQLLWGQPSDPPGQSRADTSSGTGNQNSLSGERGSDRLGQCARLR